MKATAWHQEHALKEGVLRAGLIPDGKEYVFGATDIVTTRKGVVALCKTLETVVIAGLERQEEVDPNQYDVQILGDPNIPEMNGSYGIIGTARITPGEEGGGRQLVTIVVELITVERELDDAFFERVELTQVPEIPAATLPYAEELELAHAV